MIPSMFQIAGSGRASMSMPIRVTILSRKDCYLCDVVYRIATRLQSELHIETSKVPIEGDMVLVERYGTRVPVVLLDEVEYFVGNVTEGELRRAIKKARWRKPISRILFRLGYAPRRG
jgi:predicted thioredoxin/glutaredoxin